MARMGLKTAAYSHPFSPIPAMQDLAA